MARLDIKTLVLAFENRITALEKNPPDKVPMAVILNLLERSVEEVIKDHFLHLIQKELEGLIKEQFEEMKSEFINEVLEDLLDDEEFKKKIGAQLRYKMLKGLTND